jgi:catechol 2,3-dioxygenase
VSTSSQTTPLNTPSQTTQLTPIAAATDLGAVRLTVSDIARSRAFYERAIGLSSFDHADGGVSLGVDAEHPLIELVGDSDAPALNRRATGLYHLAILLPSRRDLGFALARIAEARWPLDGASDHLVSEALYVSDPDGIGIEIYRDRPRDQWRRDRDQLQMPSEPLDLDGVIGEIQGAQELQSRAPVGTKLGHVHLQVADLGATEDFYRGVLGFDVMVRLYPGALFLSAGGYHHHIGTNVWHSRGASPPEPGAVGLRSFEIVLPSNAERDRVLDRVREAGIEMTHSDAGVLIRDPSGNGVELRTA